MVYEDTLDFSCSNLSFAAFVTFFTNPCASLEFELCPLELVENKTLIAYILSISRAENHPGM